MTIRTTALGALMALVIAPTGALAQAPGSPDPDSPAGVEYALPLDKARDDARGKERKPPKKGATKSPAPLFGEGIKKASRGEDDQPAGESPETGGRTESGTESEDSPTKSTQDEGDEPSAGGSGAGGSGAGAADADAKRTAAADSGGNENAVLAGVVGGVLLLGGALGFGLRRGFGGS